MFAKALYWRRNRVLSALYLIRLNIPFLYIVYRISEVINKNKYISTWPLGHTFILHRSKTLLGLCIPKLRLDGKGRAMFQYHFSYHTSASSLNFRPRKMKSDVCFSRQWYGAICSKFPPNNYRKTYNSFCFFLNYVRLLFTYFTLF